MDAIEQEDAAQAAVDYRPEYRSAAGDERERNAHSPETFDISISKHPV
jgi:hypothetical protein